MGFYRVDDEESYIDLTDKPQINGVTLSGNKTSADLLISMWSDPIVLTEGATSVTFSGLNTNYAYDLYSETADGTPVYVTGYSVSGTSITYTLKTITSAQTGTSGSGCKVKLKCLY